MLATSAYNLGQTLPFVVAVRSAAGLSPYALTLPRKMREEDGPTNSQILRHNALLRASNSATIYQHSSEGEWLLPMMWEALPGLFSFRRPPQALPLLAMDLRLASCGASGNL